MSEKKKRTRRKIFDPVRDRDIAERYDATRFAVTLTKAMLNNENAEVRTLCFQMKEGLTEEQLRAVNDYYFMEQKWDWMPIHHSYDNDGDGAKPMPFTPAVFRRILNWTKTQFLCWLINVADAQWKFKFLVRLLGFDAREVAQMMQCKRKKREPIKIRGGRELKKDGYARTV